MVSSKIILLKHKELLRSEEAIEMGKRGAPKMKVFLEMCMKTKDRKYDLS